MKALKNNIVYRPLVEEKKTDAGIILPSTDKSNFEKGELVMVGEEASAKEPDLVPGAKVLVSKRSSTDIELNEEKLKIIKDEGILLVL